MVVEVTADVVPGDGEWYPALEVVVVEVKCLQGPMSIPWWKWW